MADTVVTVGRKPRWQWWRDVVLILLALAVILLVRQVGDLRHQLDRTSAQRAKDQANTVQALDALRAQLAVKDARIKQLTDQLVKAGIKPAPPAPSPTPQPQSQPRPVASRSRAPEPPSPTPRPKPHPKPKPKPTPTPTCTAVVAGKCINQP